MQTLGIQTAESWTKFNGLISVTRTAPSNAGGSWAQGILQSTLTLSGYDSYNLSTPTGNLAQADNGTNVSTTQTGLSPGNGAPGAIVSQSTATLDPFGFATASSNSGLGVSPVTSTSTTDAFGRPLSTNSTGGLVSHATYGSSDWLGPASITSADGTSTNLTYTPLGQIATSIANGVNSADSYDADGNQVQNIVSAPGNSWINSHQRLRLKPISGKRSSLDCESTKSPMGGSSTINSPFFLGGDNSFENLILVPEQWHVDNFFDLHFYPEGKNPFGIN